MVKSEVLIPIFAIALFILYMALALQEVASTTTDISKYQRVLSITHYGHSELTNYFLSEIPDNLKDIYFSYRPQFLQGGENLTLNFETDSDTITNYIKEYSQKATYGSYYHGTICAVAISQQRNKIIFQMDIY